MLRPCDRVHRAESRPAWLARGGRWGGPREVSLEGSQGVPGLEGWVSFLCAGPQSSSFKHRAPCWTSTFPLAMKGVGTSMGQEPKEGPRDKGGGWAARAAPTAHPHGQGHSQGLSPRVGALRL